MKKTHNSKIGFMLIFMLSVTYTSQAQNSFTMKSAVASVQGTSSLHDLESKVTKVECIRSFQSKSTTLQSMKNVQVKIVMEGTSFLIQWKNREIRSVQQTFALFEEVYSFAMLTYRNYIFIT